MTHDSWASHDPKKKSEKIPPKKKWSTWEAIFFGAKAEWSNYIECSFQPQLFTSYLSRHFMMKVAGIYMIIYIILHVKKQIFLRHEVIIQCSYSCISSEIPECPNLNLKQNDVSLSQSSPTLESKVSIQQPLSLHPTTTTTTTTTTTNKKKTRPLRV